MSGPEANLNSYGKKYTDKINASARRMSILLKSLLSFSSLIHCKENFTAVDLNDTLKEVLKDFEETIVEKKAIINISLLPVIQAEPVQMNQLFHSLISNALKFNNGTPVIEIIAKTMTPEDLAIQQLLEQDISYAAISIGDNGIGFEESILTRSSTFSSTLVKRKMPKVPE